MTNWIVNADTPEDMRQAILERLDAWSSNYRAQARVAKRKTRSHELCVIARAYEDAGTFIRGITIEPLRVAPPVTPTQDKLI